MSIDRENCEAWFLDYYEGNLSKEGVEALFSFLILNPDLREVFDSYEEVSFSPDKKVHFDGKADLKKSVELADGINELNYEEYFVAEVEGLTSAEEKIALENFIVLHPSKRTELDLLRKAILVPDEGIVFEHKASLMKSVLVSEEDFDEMAIASMEGLLNAEEEKGFTASLAGSVEQQNAFALYKQTKLSADTSVVFEDKESLKREENDRGGFWWMRDIRFAAAAVFALLLGIFFFNYSGNDEVKKDKGDLAKIDTSNSKKQISPLPHSNDQMANNSGHDNVPNPIESNGNPKNKTNDILVPLPNVNEKDPFVALACNYTNGPLKNRINAHVDFTDAYYNYATFKSNSPVASNDISLRQAAMRWMKKKLDNSFNGDQENAQDRNTIYSAYTASNNQSGNVTGFDLTSSVVNRVGAATGANVHLGKEAEGTIFSLGKYRVMLKHNR
ncbi:MAG: hypothetical protein NT084_03605 [Bacteroidetes bacterium]|nr:hypothetical protein [Bacteroidota bacterium]